MSRRTAGLLIEVHAIGKPGRVRCDVSNTGPEMLTSHEALHLLREAVAMFEANTASLEEG